MSEMETAPNLDSLKTLSNNWKEYLQFPIDVLKETANGMTSKLFRILGDTFDDGEGTMKNFISTTTMRVRLEEVNIGSKNIND